MEEQKSIKSFKAVRYDSGITVTPDHNYSFEYSKTGSVKLTGMYSPKYFKKEILNSYEFVHIGKSRLVLFTEGFDVDMDKCIEELIRIYLANSEMQLESLTEHIIYLKQELSKYNNQ